jgi:hypothetical protein
VQTPGHPDRGERFARILFSLFSTPSSTLDMDDPDMVADFVRAHVVRGSPTTVPAPADSQPVATMRGRPPVSRVMMPARSKSASHPCMGHQPQRR